jgi:uncharacterized protein with ParB-like and HNH nuclease domain
MAKKISPSSDEEDDRVLDEAANDDSTPIIHYDITSFGADYDVDGLVKRLKRGEIKTPDFQRQYVWNIKLASRLIESLLLGLPVPGVFMVREPETNKLLVIDGHQRLKTLLFFYEGSFNPKENDDRHRQFKLVDVQKPYNGCTYKTLSDKDRIQLDNTIIHATIIKQDAPANDDTSIIHIFERLNTGGLKLTAQEVRTATCHGTLIELLKELNTNQHWRSIFGRTSIRLKDQELILRFLALNNECETYERPINEFLNKFASKHRNATTKFLDACRKSFSSTIDTVFKSIGAKAFRPVGTLNAAVFDSVMVGIARRLKKGPIEDQDELLEAYEALLVKKSYSEAILSATSDEKNVETRLKDATEAFEDVK